MESLSPSSGKYRHQRVRYEVMWKPSKARLKVKLIPKAISEAPLIAVNQVSPQLNSTPRVRPR
jgi:hypothetical protein